MHPKSNQTLLELLAVACCGLLLAVLHHNMAEPVEIGLYKDEPRYINYALSLSEHSTFGISHDYTTNVDTPGAANTPAYPAILAFAVLTSQELRDTLLCIQADPSQQTDCKHDYTAILVVQYTLSIITLAGIWVATRIWFAQDSRLIPVFALLFAAASGVLFGSARELRTEVLVLPLFAWMMVLWLQLQRSPSRAKALGLGGILGLLTLTRPEYLYLTAFVLVLMAVTRRQRHLAIPVAVVFILTLSPWLLRNQLQVGSPALTAASYGDTVLVQRLTYNRMEWPQWLAAFVYYIPDTGDRWSEVLFPPAWYEPLKDNAPDSYMSHWPEQQQLAHEAAAGGSVLNYLITHEILPDAAWHVTTSLPLAWRGLFVGKYWGMLGLIALIIWCIHSPQVLWWLTPIGFLIVLHAGVSISIPRYNIMLLIPYSIALARGLVLLYTTLGRSRRATQDP